MAEPWTDLKVEVEKGRFFWFGGPYAARELWQWVLAVLDTYQKPFPLSMKIVKRGSIDDGVTILPRKDGTAPGVLAAPAFHLWCGVPQAVVEARQVAQEHQLKDFGALGLPFIEPERRERGPW